MDLKECCAQRIDREAFAALLDEYAAHMPKFRDKEIYKWQAVRYFQEHWDLDAEDLAGMLDDVLGHCGSLLMGSMWFPKGMLVVLAQAEPDAVRSAFSQTLFDEQIPLFDRLGAFASLMTAALAKENDRRADLGEDPAQKHYQDSRSMSVYLACWKPAEYPLYKANMYKALAKELGLEVPANKYEKVVACQSLYQQMAVLMEELRPELIAASDALLGDDLATLDSAHLLLAQDIAFYVDYWREELKSNDLTKLSSSEIEEMFIEWVKPQVKKKTYPNELANSLANRRKQGYNVAPFLSQYATAFECTDTKEIAAARTQSLKFENDSLNFHNWVSAALAKYGEFLEWLSSGKQVVKVDGMPSEENQLEDTDLGDGSYTDDDFLEEVYMDEPALYDMKALLRRKKNLILQGSPGTGKTFAAKRLAWCMMGEQDDSRIQMVQFHQSSTYDDFVVGYRPKEEGGFRIAEGTFVKFCRKAAADPARDYFFIIDEINRANISKVFGELLMLIEADHRGDEITLSVGDLPFSVPKNIYLIGMMNTADRGLALIDYALRRRFAFFEMEPALRHDLFIERVETIGDPHMKQFIKAVDLLNKVIAEDEALGRGFRIGHSYFCDTGTEGPTGEGTAESVLKYEIEPLVEEYWFDDQDKAEAEIKKLRDSLQ